MTRAVQQMRAGWQRAAELIRGLAALVVLLALLVGLPVLLYAVAGLPVPHRLPSPGQVTDLLTRRDDGQLFLACLLILAWLGWAAFAVCVEVEAAAQLRGHGAPRLPALGGPQRLAGQLVAAVAVTFLGTGPLLTPLAPGHMPPAPPVAAVALHLPAVAAPVAPQAAERREPATSTPVHARRTLKQYAVARGDTLWGIAHTHLGDPERYREIARLNYGRPQPDGRALTSTHWIYPGWVLLLPADATGISTTATPESEMRKPPAPPRHGGTAPQHAATTPSPPDATATRPAAPPGATATVDAVPSNTAGHDTPATPQPADDQNQPAANPVELPSGSLVAGSFAAGVAAAVALGRLRRRHAYRPHPPAPGRCLAPSPLSPTVRRLSAATRRATDEDNPVDVSPPPDALPSDDPDRRNHPDRIEVATHDGQSVSVTLTALKGVALTGRGGDDAARVWITATLVRGGALASEILITAAAAERLFPGRPDTPGISVVDDRETLLRRVELATLSRSRQLADADIADATTYRDARPYEPLPTLIAVTESIPAEHAGRWRTAMRAGGPLAIAALVLTDSDAVNSSVEVDADHFALSETADGNGVPNGARLFALTADEACEVLLALADSEARPDTDHPTDVPPPSEPPAGTALAGTGPSPLRDPDDTHQPGTEPWPDSAKSKLFDTALIAGPTLLERGRTSPTAPVAVRLLGPYTISVDGEVVSTGLRSVAKELLAWYLLRPDGATVEAAVDALWPDTDPRQVHRQFWLAASNLRTRLRSRELPELKVLAQAGDVYRPEAGTISCDLWDFQAALRAAVRASDDTTVQEALHAAVDAYGGEFAATTDYLWAQPVRADLHRRALDAHLRLAEIEERLGRPEDAADVLERAIGLDGVAEEPYRRLMAVQARLGHPEALRATWRTLQRHLADLDIDPEPATVRIYRQLTEPPDAHTNNRRSTRGARIAG